MSVERKKKSLRRRLLAASLVLICGGAWVVIKGVAVRQESYAELRDWTDAQAVPTVAVAAPQMRGANGAIEVPGRLEAYYRAPIFARVNGYLKSWKVDIGAHVKSGQLLAEIDAPDLDQQLLQARADLLNAQAAEKLSEVTLKRRQALLTSNFASQQDVDERVADLGSKQAGVKSAEANVERLEALSAYKNITAPFDGIVTARNTDVGALINAGAGSAPPMFVVSDVSKLRVYVDVPQSYVAGIKTGAQAQISVPERPGRTFPAVLEASSQSVDAQTGTSQMQLALANPDGALLPGGYAVVRLRLDHDVEPLYLPASALIFDQTGLRVATVGPSDRVAFKTVAIARDLGAEVEIASGLSPDDKVIVTPMDGLAQGEEVHVLDAQNKAVASEEGSAKTNDAKN
jgi:membrane fusion protein (multidrug efflux system)